MKALDTIKEFLATLVTRLAGLDTKEFNQIMLGIIGGVCSLALGAVYYVESRSSRLLKDIELLQAQQKKTRRLLIRFAELAQDEQRFNALVEQYKNFSMKVYFEQFCKDLNIVAQSGWDTTIHEISDQADEVSLTATFRDMTTQRLVSILQELDKKELVYVKSLRVRPDKDRKISFDITLASIRTK